MPFPVGLIWPTRQPANAVQRKRIGVRPMMGIRNEARFSSYGPPFLYTAANWGTVAWYLEVYLKSTSAKALARLYDNTSAAEVASSTITVDGVFTYARQRSSALTLTDGHEYQVQFGNQDQGAGAFTGAKLIAI